MFFDKPQKKILKLAELLTDEELGAVISDLRTELRKRQDKKRDEEQDKFCCA